MLKDKNILAVVPARGGSKGVKLKNIKLLCGKPLIEHTALVINQIEIIDTAVVSTDSEEIGSIAESAGINFSFKRPVNLSGDFIGDWDVLNHALIKCEKIYNKKFDIVLMLQPTSPLRTTEDIIGSVNYLIENQLDAVWSMSPTDSKNHPLKQFRIENDLLDYYDYAGNKIIARQQLDTLYQKNGAVYVFTRDCILNQKTIKGKKTGAYLIHREMVSIDTAFDFKLVEFLMENSDEKK